MSVYHSIRSSQAGTESFLDLGAAESTAAEPEPEPESPSQEEQAQLERQNRATSARFDRHHAAEQKKIELARRSLMVRLLSRWMPIYLRTNADLSHTPSAEQGA